MPAKRKSASKATPKSNKEDTKKRSKDEMEQPQPSNTSAPIISETDQESKKPKFSPPEDKDLHLRIQWNTNELWDSSTIQETVTLFAQSKHLEISFFQNKTEKTWRQLIKQLDQYHFVEYTFHQSTPLSPDLTLLIVQILNQRFHRLGYFYLRL